jgi:hypothetical protein
MLVVKPDRLIIRWDGDKEPLILANTEVVSIKGDGLPLLKKRAIVVDHIAFDKAGTVLFYPVEETTDFLLLRISCAGFKPKAAPVPEWDPARGPPPVP